MKLAVILGVVHMLFGIVLKGVNALHFRSCIDFIFEFLPMFIFMIVTFVFMDTLIVVKWLTDLTAVKKYPSIITIMINMPLGLMGSG